MLPFRSVKNFYPRPPRGGRPPAVARGYPSAKISIHALREEGDVGGDPALGLFGISIHALREEGDAGPQLRERPERISIHALREEGDEEGPKVFRLKTNFYPRPPRGGRPLTVRLSALPRSFLSTPSARRATSASLPCRSPARFLSTPSARRATVAVVRVCFALEISIHALREEGDPTTPVTVRCMFLFLSTPSARRATMSGQGSFVPTEDFYPRPPRGGRRLLICAADLGGHISIHALREEGDEKAQD